MVPCPLGSMEDEVKMMDHVLAARQVVRHARSGALGTLARETGQAYVSLAAYACDYDVSPVFLLSDLADHTKNVHKNSQVSLLCEQASHLANPQAGPRVTLMGTLEKVTGDHECSIFEQCHPSSKMYAGFGDFNFYRLTIEKAHYVGGFGRAIWIDGAALCCDSAASLYFRENQKTLISVLNSDYPDLARDCATKLLKLRGKNWKILRIDPDGLTLKLASKIVRYPFEKQVENETELHQVLAELEL